MLPWVVLMIQLVTGVYGDDTVYTRSSWWGGHAGTTKLWPDKNYGEDWSFYLTFSSSIDLLEIWSADIVGPSSGREFLLKGKPGNGHQANVGKLLEIEYVARYQGENHPSVSARFADGGSGTPPPPTTTTTTSPTTTGTGSEGQTSKYNLGQVLHKSILFYEAQRSGRLPASNRVPWRGDSALQDGSDNGLDLTGGWYDAGDMVKFGFPMAWTATTLIWGLIEFEDAYRQAGELDNMYDSVKWALDYFIKCHPSKYVFYGQVGNGAADHAFWGRPEDMTMARPSYKITDSKPGSDLAGETAAALAAGYIAFKDKNATYAGVLLQHSKDLYDFAYNHRGVYTSAIGDAGSYYSSSGYNDELSYAGAWLYRATGDEGYKTKGLQFYNGAAPWAFSWDNKYAAAQLLFYITTQESKYKTDITNSINPWLKGGSISYTPKGLAFRDRWGSLRYAANMAALAVIAAKYGIRSTDYQNFATQQIGYALGDTGRSFVVGFGTNPPVQPHHRAASCPDHPAPCGNNEMNYNGPSPQVLNGALVGGPDQGDGYVDRRTDYTANEVACDYNAGFQTAVAGLKHFQA